MTYALFTGCLIPFRLPSWEKTSREVLSRLGVEIVDISDFSCCPTPVNTKTTREDVWYALAARNLALAEMKGLDILCLCSGCSESLKMANFKLRTSRKAREEVNSGLSRIGLEIKGNLEVKHVVELLLEIGLDAIKEKVIRPLRGLRVACHYGCHLLKPSEAVAFDDPLKPKSLDLLVTALGADSVEYENKMLCCGGELSLVDRNDAEYLARIKLDEVKRKADCLTVVCPFCFLQYDLMQLRMEKKPDVPVFFYMELLGLALGINQEELGLAGHKINVSSAVNAIDARKKIEDQLSSIFDLGALKKCLICGACKNTCHTTTEKFNPHAAVEMLLDGRIDEVLEKGEFWRCTECYTCYELCPQRMGLIEVFSKLKKIALEKGYMPEGILSQQKSILSSGLAASSSTSLRKRFSLPNPPMPKIDELRRLLKTERT